MRLIKIKTNGMSPSSTLLKGKFTALINILKINY